MRRPKLANFEQRFGRPAVMFTCAVGVLIWLKLRLVTGVPRSVYAEPGLPSPQQSAREREVWLRTYATPRSKNPTAGEIEQPQCKLAPLTDFD